MDNTKPTNPFDREPLKLPEPTPAYMLGQQRAERGLAREEGWKYSRDYQDGFESGLLALRLGIVKSLDGRR